MPGDGLLLYVNNMKGFIYFDSIRMYFEDVPKQFIVHRMQVSAAGPFTCFLLIPVCDLFPGSDMTGMHGNDFGVEKMYIECLAVPCSPSGRYV
jgi:hypothetical protein